eukprot:11512229-Alexandrium_andersonii.AAC.1
MSASLVGSEMCIRDRWRLGPERQSAGSRAMMAGLSKRARGRVERGTVSDCLLYTSDAADDM